MLEDLSGRGELALEADLVVIGAGTVGLPVSVTLAQRTGKRVVCLETGGIRQDVEVHPLNDVVFVGARYKGASEGRFRCLGGASTRWGGALIPFQEADLQGLNWPISYTELEPYLAEVEALFLLEGGPYADARFPFDLGEHHVHRLAKWPQFKKRNVAALYEATLRTSENIRVWLNAHVVEILTNAGGVGVTARSLAGDKLHVTARKLIIAAGAIETTRLALLIDRQNGGAVSAVSPPLGRYFSDHISAEVAELVVSRPIELNRFVGFRFGPKGSMRNIRFELAPDTPARRELPPSFVHIGFQTKKPGGFDALREIFQNLQRRQPPPLHTAFELIRNAPWLARAVVWRFAYKRMLFPAQSRLVAHAVIEQTPLAENRIGLSQDRTDPFGAPLAEISWRVSDRDKANILATAELMRRTWQTSGLTRLAEWKPLDDEEIWASLDASEGIFHPTGSTRMGCDAASGVVDKNLNLFGVPNIQLLATSVLPTGGGANPTMMLLLLAMRCIEQHVCAR